MLPRSGGEGVSTCDGLGALPKLSTFEQRAEAPERNAPGSGGRSGNFRQPKSRMARPGWRGFYRRRRRDTMTRPRLR